MREIRLGRTDVKVPSVGVGTWAHGGPNRIGGVDVGWSGNDDRLSRAALLEAYDSGLIHWDTADVYGSGHSEKLIGDVWDEVPRNDVFLATKVGWDAGDHDYFYHPAQIRKQFESSLRNLRVDHVDLYYLHHCNFGEGGLHLDDAIETVRRFQDEGTVRFIGLSDWDSAAVLRYGDRVNPDVVQVCRNVRTPMYSESGLKQWVEDNDVGAVFFSALDYGLLLGKYQGTVEFPEGDARNRIEGFRNPHLIEKLQRFRRQVEEKFGHHPQPVLHALVGSLLADSPTGCVLVGQRNPDQVRAAAAATEALSPSDAEWVQDFYNS